MPLIKLKANDMLLGRVPVLQLTLHRLWARAWCAQKLYKEGLSHTETGPLLPLSE